MPGSTALGAMVNAKWRRVPLKAILAKAGIHAAAKQVPVSGVDVRSFITRVKDSGHVPARDRRLQARTGRRVRREELQDLPLGRQRQHSGEKMGSGKMGSEL
jgi:hypothetical protein